MKKLVWSSSLGAHSRAALGAMLFSMALLAPHARSQSTDVSPVPREPTAGERFQVEGPSARQLTLQVAPIGPMLPLASIGGSWTAQGPGPTTGAQVQNLNPNNEVSGAIHAVVAHPTDPAIFYLGAVNGGIWRTGNATAPSPTWTPLTDFEQSLSIGALEMDPGNPQILLAGIGRFSSFGGDPPFMVAGGDLSGLLRTTDSGATWTSITDPLLVGEHISSVASRGSTLLAGANDFFGGGGTGGLFRSTDAGATWTQITGALGTGLPLGTVDDLAGDPSNAGRLYVALQGNGVYRTDDTGATWTQVSNADATLNAAMLGSTNTRIAVGSNAARAFVLVTSGSAVTYIGYTDDQGATWTQMDVPGTVETPLRGRDELMGMVVDPANPSDDIVYVSAISQRSPFPNSIGATSFHAHMFRGDATLARGLTGNVSSQWDHITHLSGAGGMPNGGTTNTSSPHADSREMTFDANGNLIEVDDGGVNRRTTPGNNAGDWFSINGGIQVTELHSIAYDTNFGIIIGGTQDTGTPEQSAPGSTSWNTLAAADGGKVAVDDSVAGTSVRYFSFQNLGSFTRRTCNPGCVNVLAPLTGRNAAQFYTPLEVNANDPTRLLLGTRFGLSESMDQGATASVVPGSAVTANSDARMVYGHPNDGELIYVGAGAQVFVRTTAGGANLAPTAGAFPGGTVFGVTVDPTDPNGVYAIGNTTVYESVDGGASWTDISGNIADDGAGTFRAIAYVTGATVDLIAVGTNAGVLVSFASDFGTWHQLGTTLPNAPVWDLDYDATDDVLVAGTLGRGAWTMTMVSQLNVPPVALCKNATVSTDPGVCEAAVDPSLVDNGSFDPDGTIVGRELTPAGPYPLGMTDVSLEVTDDEGAEDSCDAKTTVEDNEPPMVECNVGSGTIVPPDAPISFTASATDNCLAETGATAVITGFDCFKFTKKGKRIDKTGSCVLSFAGDEVTIWDSGGVADHITWNVTATDGSGNTTNDTCEVVVVNPGKKP